MEPTDIELMLRVRGGEVAAFRELLGRYREPLRRFFAALLADPSQAEDFVQETFLRLWLSRERYEPTGRFSTYLFQIGKHYWLNQRKKLRLPLAEEPIDPELRAGPLTITQPETILLEQYRQMRIRRAIDALPEHYRAVFEMSHLDGLKYAEIAGRLGIPVGTVKSRMAEAVRRLRQALSGEEDEGGV
jgi:RNA polymerase sigma-70 factor (ECF subfamily)